jgi:hypothetical protein
MGQLATAKTEADPYGMDKQKNNGKGNGKSSLGKGVHPTYLRWAAMNGAPELLWGERRADRFAIAHLNDDKAVVKMGHPRYGLGGGWGGEEGFQVASVEMSPE